MCNDYRIQSARQCEDVNKFDPLEMGPICFTETSEWTSTNPFRATPQNSERSAFNLTHPTEVLRRSEPTLVCQFQALFDLRYVGRSTIYLPKQQRRQWADWNKSVRVGTCLEVSHMEPQLSAILSEWQHVKWACVWALSRRAAPTWQRASAHVCKISSCHSAMWVPTAKSPAPQSGPSSLGLFYIPS